MKSVRYRRAARTDLESIADQGQARWGREAAEAYIRSIDRSLHSLLEFPAKGSFRHSVMPRLRKWTVLEHHAYYQLDEVGIDVVRILHPAMDVTQAFGNDT